MRDELDRMILSYFEAQVKGIPQRPFPSFQQEAASLGEARVMPRFRKTGRHPVILKPAALPLRLAGAVAIAVICIFLAPRRTSSPVARGAEALMGNTEFHARIFSAAAEVTLQTGKSLRKE